MIAAVALLLAAGAPLPEAAPFFLALEATPEQVALGDLVEVRLVVEHDARDVYSLPAFDPSPMATPKGAAAPRSRRSDLGGGKARTEFERAASLAKNARDRAYLLGRSAACRF